MKQPELGLKIKQLRDESGFTQEELAEKSGLTARSIQRIESGEVMPRLSTLKLMSDALQYDLLSAQKREVTIWLVLLHLSSFIPLIFVPVIIWVLKKDEFPELDKHGIDVINFQISMCIYLFGSAMLVLIVIGLPLLVGIGWYCAFITIFNTVKVAMGKEYKYYLSINFIK